MSYSYILFIRIHKKKVLKDWIGDKRKQVDYALCSNLIGSR